MRRTLPDQLPLVPAFHTHVRSRELEAMSRILDAHPEAARWVLDGLVGRRVSSRHGREGMSGEQVLRVILVKQLDGFSYDERSLHLADSMSYRTFCRIGIAQKVPTSKTLQRNVKMVQPRTLEKNNRLLVEHASAAGIEDGKKLRVDCTVMETNIHEPTDSSLLWDSVRVLTRLINRAREYADVAFTDHQRVAKRRALAPTVPCRPIPRA
jgi:IS5 family transposase